MPLSLNKINPICGFLCIRYVGTGNLHIAIYDHSNMFMHVATARSDGESGELNAFQRQFLRLNMTAIFDEPRPTNSSLGAPEDQCKKDSYAFCCEIGAPCDCSQTVDAVGQYVLQRFRVAFVACIIFASPYLTVHVVVGCVDSPYLPPQVQGRELRVLLQSWDTMRLHSAPALRIPVNNNLMGSPW